MKSILLRWHILTAAPHRVMFLAGAIQALAAIAWWLDALMRPAQAGIGLALGAVWIHAFLMIYAFFPFFIFGFLFTTYPNWMGAPKITFPAYVSTFCLMSAGTILFYAGTVWGLGLLAGGAGLLASGWLVALSSLARLWARTPHPDKRHPGATTVALAAGWLGLLAYIGGLVTGDAQALAFALTAGIWFCLVPVFLTVSHRMIPFFSSCVLEDYKVWRPYRLLWAALGLAVLHGCLSLAGLAAWRWVADAPLAAIALTLSAAWGLRRAFQVRLLAVLHVSFLWLGLACLLYAASSLMALLDGSGRHALGFAPLHALAIGYFAGMVIAMASRVTLGHSGRPLVADGATWLLFWGLQAVVVLRLAPDIAATLGHPLFRLYPVAALAWLACFVPWFAKYAPIYLRTRADGRPG
ncbi:MAG: NnrS family protein [Betaproteobacteria bacterium]|nr:NnrS family protein [Betaproteobacteria bacterium]